MKDNKENIKSKKKKSTNNEIIELDELGGNENSENEATNQSKNKKTKKKKSKAKSEIRNDTCESLEPLKMNNKSKGEDEIILPNEKKKSKKKSKVKLNHSEPTSIEELLEVNEPGDIVKTISKEDISTLNKNLKAGPSDSGLLCYKGVFTKLKKS